MKILLLLLIFLANGLIHAFPLWIFYQLKTRFLSYLNVSHVYIVYHNIDFLLLPYVLWFVLNLFDTTRKTYLGFIYPETVFISLSMVILIFIQIKLFDFFPIKRVIQISTVIACLIALFVWYLVTLPQNAPV